MPEYLLLACRFGRARPRGGMGQVKIEFVRKGQVENVSLQSLFTLTGSLRSSSQFVCVEKCWNHFCIFLARQLHFGGKGLACTLQKGIQVYSILCHGYINVPAARSPKKAEMLRACVVLSKISDTKIAMTQLFLPNWALWVRFSHYVSLESGSVRPLVVVVWCVADRGRNRFPLRTAIG